MSTWSGGALLHGRLCPVRPFALFYFLFINFRFIYSQRIILLSIGLLPIDLLSFEILPLDMLSMILLPTDSLPIYTFDFLFVYLLCHSLPIYLVATYVFASYLFSSICHFPLLYFRLICGTYDGRWHI